MGAPDVAGCGDLPGARTTSETQPQHIRVAFERPLVPTAVRVHQDNAVGFVRRLVLWTRTGVAHEREVTDTLAECLGVATFDNADLRALVTEVTVVVDPQHASGYEEIDAIEIEGRFLR